MIIQTRFRMIIIMILISIINIVQSKLDFDELNVIYSDKTVGMPNTITIPIKTLTISNGNTDPFCITIIQNNFIVNPGAKLTIFQSLSFTQTSIAIRSDKVIFCFDKKPATTINNDSLKIEGMINPSYSSNQSFVVFTSDANGDQLQLYPITHDYFGFATIRFDVAAMTTITKFLITSVDNKVYSSNLLMTINSVIDIPVGYKIDIQFPIQWESFGCPIIDSTIGSLSCTIPGGAIRSSCVQSTLTPNTLQQIEMIVDSVLTKNTDYIITLNGLRTPPSMDTYLLDFILLIKNNNGIMYQNIKTQIPALTIKNSLTISNVIYSSNVKVNAIPNSETLNVEINLTTPVNSINYSLELELSFNLSTLNTSSLSIVGSGICNTVNSSQYSISDIGNKFFRIKFNTAYESTLPVQQCKLQIPKVKAGGYLNYKGTVRARTFKLNTKAVDEGESQVGNLLIVQDDIYRQELSTLVENVGAVGVYTFNFDLNQGLSQNSFIIIQYTSNIISIPAQNCQVTCATYCSGSANCVVDTSKSQIRLTSIFTSDMTNNISTSTTLAIQVTLSNVVNPKSVVTPQPSDNFKIFTYYDSTEADNHLVQSTNYGNTAMKQFSAYKALTLSPLGVAITNQIIRQNINKMVLTFSFPNFFIMANSKYEITFSKDSVLMGGSSNGFTATWLNNEPLIEIGWVQNINQITLKSNSEQKDNLGLVLAGDIKNPFSTIRQHTVSLRITDSSDKLIATTSGTYSVSTVDSTSAILTIVRSGTNSDQNSAIATYTFTITNPSNIVFQQNYQIIITLPTFNGVPLQANNCQPGTTSVSSCIPDLNDSTKLSLNINASTSDPLNFKIDIQNYISKQMIIFKCLITEQDARYQIYSTQTNVQNQNTSQLDFQAIPSSLESDIEVTWTITLRTLTPNSEIPLNSKIIIQFPVDFTESKLANASITCSCINQVRTGREISVQSNVKNMNIISISKIFNPGPYVLRSDQLNVYIKDSIGNDIADGIVDSNNDNIRYVYKCDITCRTCDPVVKSICYTCYSDRSFQNNKCVEKCDPGYYSSTDGTKVCVSCKNNCQTCSSDTVCITCQNSYFFVPDTKQCVSSCSTLESYYPSNNTCLKCDSKCFACTGKEICQQCSNGYYFIAAQNKCVSAADCNNLNLYLKGNQCVPCEDPCATCVQTYNQCASCQDTSDFKYLQGNQCQKKCNVGYYSDGGNKCQQCDSLCNVCEGNSRNCSECIPTAGFYLNKCYTTCPEIAPLNINGQCTPCEKGCSSCTAIDKCLICSGSLLLHKNTCVQTCPANYQTDKTSTKCELKEITTILSDNLSDNKFVPFPYLIALIIWIAIVMCSRNRAQETFVAGCVVGIGSVIEFATWITFFALQTNEYSLNSQYNKLFLAGLILHFLFNTINLIFYISFIRKDSHFIYWVSQIQNKICHAFIRFFSFVLTHKFENFIYSRFFGFSFFSAKLSSTSTFLQYNILSGLSIVFVSFPLIISAAATCYYDDIFEQMFIEGLEVIIISVIMMGFQIANIKKPKDFFLQKTADGLNPLNSHLTHHLDPVPVQSRLFGTYTGSNFGGNGGQSDRPEFNFSNRVSIIGEVEKPLTFGYKLKTDPIYYQAPNNNNLSYLNSQNAKHQITANDQSIDFINNPNPKQFYLNQDLSLKGSVYDQTNTELQNNTTTMMVANLSSLHSQQELGEVFKKGKRNYETRSIQRLNTQRPKPIEEQFEDDEDDFGQGNLHSKLQMTGDEVNMRKVDLMNQSSNLSNNQYYTMRSARSNLPTKQQSQLYSQQQQAQLYQQQQQYTQGSMNNQGLNLSNRKPALNSSRPPSNIMTEKKVGNRFYNNPNNNNNIGGSKVMTPTRQNTYMQSQNQMTTNPRLQTNNSPHMQPQISPHNLNQIQPYQNYMNSSGKHTPKRSVSIGVNEQDLLESSIYPRKPNNQPSNSQVYDQRIGNRSTKEQSYMSPVRTMQNTKEINFQNNISARSRSRSASPIRPPDQTDQFYKKMNHLRSKSRDRLDFEDDEDQPQYLEGNIDRLRNGQYQTKNPQNINKFNGEVVSPESSPEKNEIQTFDNQSRMNSKIGTNLDELDLLREPSYYRNKTNQTIEKVGSEETDNEDIQQQKLQKVSHLNSQLFYLSNPMERPVQTPSEDESRKIILPMNTNIQPQQIRKLSGENKEDSSRVQQIQAKIENLDVNEYDPYGLNQQANEKAKKMRRPSNQNIGLDKKSMIQKQQENNDDDENQSNSQDLDSQRIDGSSSDEPPIINQHKMVGPPIIPGETIQSNNSPPKRVLQDVQGVLSQKNLLQQQQNQQSSIRSSQVVNRGIQQDQSKNLLKPPLRPTSNNNNNNISNQESDEEDEDIINNKKNRSIDNNSSEDNNDNNNNVRYGGNEEYNKENNKVRQLFIKQNGNSTDNILQENQIDKAGNLALQQIRVVTPMTTMINPRELQKIEFANQQNNQNSSLRSSSNNQQHQIIDNHLEDDNLIQKSKELDHEFIQQKDKTNISQIIPQNDNNNNNNNVNNNQQNNVRQSNQFKNDAQPIMTHHDQNDSPKNITNENNQMKSKNHSIRGSYSINPQINNNNNNNKSQNPNDSMNKYTDISATKTDNFDYHPLNLDEFGNGGGLYSHQQSINMIGHTQSQQNPNTNGNNGIPQIFRDNSTISAIAPHIHDNQSQGFNLRNTPSAGELNKNNYFGLSAKEYEGYNNTSNTLTNNNKKQSPTHSHSIANQYYQKNPLDNLSRHQRRDVDDIYDSQESIRTASEAQMDFNEISPSDFNVLNQRYDDDAVVENSQSSQQQLQIQQQQSKILTKAMSQAPSYYEGVNNNNMIKPNNDQEEKFLINNFNQLKNHQQNDNSFPSHIRNSRKSENIISLSNNNQNDIINKRGLQVHSNTNSITSINQKHHNFMLSQQNQQQQQSQQQQLYQPQYHPMIITSNNQRNPTVSDNGTKRDNNNNNNKNNIGFNDNIRHLSDSRSVSQNLNTASDNQTISPLNYQQNQMNNNRLMSQINPQIINHHDGNTPNSHLHYNLNQQSYPIHHNTAGDHDDSYIDLTSNNNHDNTILSKKSNTQLNRNATGGGIGLQQYSQTQQDISNRNNNNYNNNTQKTTPTKQDPMEKLKNLEKIYLQRIENSITNSKSNNSLQKKGQTGRKTPQNGQSSQPNSKTKRDHSTFTPKNNNQHQRLPKDTNDALFLDDQNDYQDIDF